MDVFETEKGSLLFLGKEVVVHPRWEKAAAGLGSPMIYKIAGVRGAFRLKEGKYVGSLSCLQVKRLLRRDSFPDPVVSIWVSKYDPITSSPDNKTVQKVDGSSSSLLFFCDLVSGTLAGNPA